MNQSSQKRSVNRLVKLGVLGLSYRTAPLDLRAKAAFSNQDKITLAQQLSQAGVKQCMVLSTCNRSEIYYLYPSGVTPFPEQIKGIFLAVCNASQELSQHLYQLEGTPALEQLFRVAAGLDSLVLGEDQILGQIQEAAAFSRATGSSGKELNRIIQNAVTCAKAVKTAYPVSQQPLSLCYIGMKKIEQQFGIQNKTACVIGSGKMAMLAVRHLVAMGCKKIFLCCRNTQAGKALEQEFSPVVCLHSFGYRAQAIGQSDIVVSATSAPHLVVTQQELANCNQPMALLDLAVPRDIVPEAANSDQRILIDIDSLKQTEKENLEKRHLLAQQSEQDITTAIEETEHWLSSCAVDAPIQTLRERVQEVEQDTAQLLCDKLGLDSHQQKVLKKLLHAGMNRLLKDPIHQLKELQNEQEQARFADAVDYLFRKPKE